MAAAATRAAGEVRRQRRARGEAAVAAAAVVGSPPLVVATAMARGAPLEEDQAAPTAAAAAEAPPGGRYVSLATAWKSGKPTTKARQVCGRALPPSSCCLHVLPSAPLPLSEAALRDVRRVHERGLARGGTRCAQNARARVEAAFRGRPLAVRLVAAPGASAAARAAAAAAAETLAGGTVLTLSACAVLQALAAELPGEWRLQCAAQAAQAAQAARAAQAPPLPASGRLLRDALSPPPWGADAVTLQAECVEPRGGAAGEADGVTKERAVRLQDLRDRLSKVCALREGTRGTPESENAERQCKKIRLDVQRLRQDEH